MIVFFAGGIVVDVVVEFTVAGEALLTALERGDVALPFALIAVTVKEKDAVGPRFEMGHEVATETLHTFPTGWPFSNMSISL